MDFKKIVNEIVQDVAVDLSQEFDRNFERKAFFDQKWPEAKHFNSSGSLLLRTGQLRQSINHTQQNTSIRWHSSLPYATIHNEGGELVVTEKMKRFFWAMYYKASGGVSNSGSTARDKKLTSEASKWKKAMALLKVGTKMKIDQRQFIGWHPEVDRHIRLIVDTAMNKYSNQIIKKP